MSERLIEGDFVRDGAVCVRRAFGPEAMRLATEAIEANLGSLSPLAKRGMYQGPTWLPATNSSVDSRSTGSTGNHMLAFFVPSTL